MNNSLRTFCFDYLKLEEVRNPKAKTDAPSLNKDVMAHYLATLENGPARTFIETLLGKRSRDTACAYLKGYLKFGLPLSPQFPDWLVLHPNLNPTGTDTLRFSSSNPNEQNVSKKDDFNLRFAFGPAPGREWYTLDAQNIELRLPAYKSEEGELIGLFERPKDPPYYGSTHLLNFHTVYPDIWDKELGSRCDNPKCCGGKIVDLTRIGPHCKKKYAGTWYQWCKNGGFAIQYGAVDRAGGGGTADRAFHRNGSHSRLKARFARLEKLNRRVIAFAEKHGYVETLPDRSVDPDRGYPLLVTRTDNGTILPTVPLSYCIQGTAMWWTMMGMIRCQEKLDEWRERDGFDGKMVLQVHDELAFDFPRKGDPAKDLAREKAGLAKVVAGTPIGYTSNLWRVRILQKLMAKCGDDLGVPTPVGVEYHTESWSTGVTL